VAVAVLPRLREWIVPAQSVTGGEKEQRSAVAMRDAKRAQGFHHQTSAAVVSRDGEHAECIPSELPFVLFGGVGGELRARSVKVPCVEEARQPVVGAIERAVDERCDVRRSQEALRRASRRAMTIFAFSTRACKSFMMARSPNKTSAACESDGPSVHHIESRHRP
jgi:hypothetical protein